MAKGFNIKNVQIAEALSLGGIKGRLKLKKQPAGEGKEQEEKKGARASEKAPLKEGLKKAKRAPETPAGTGEVSPEEPHEEVRRVKARSKSVFHEELSGAETLAHLEPTEAPLAQEEAPSLQTPEEAVEAAEPIPAEETAAESAMEEILGTEAALQATEIAAEETFIEETPSPATSPETAAVAVTPIPAKPKLGPTGRHVKDLLPKSHTKAVEAPPPAPETEKKKGKKEKGRDKAVDAASVEDLQDIMSGKKGTKHPFKEFKDVKPRRQQVRTFDSRDKYGLRDTEESEGWHRRRKHRESRSQELALEEVAVRPTSLKVRLPVSVKDFAANLKIKAAELIAKLFLQGVAVTLNDSLDDETTVKLLGEEFGCSIDIDTTEEERIRITDQTIKEEIKGTPGEKLKIRAPVAVFMGHVDHGKTSLIDAIRKSNIAAGEAGAITQHIGAFRCKTAVGDITILDTPGHEAFSAMRARGAEVTDIVVLVVAGDEGIRQQTDEAIQHAKAANCPIVVAVNKCDKRGFDPDNVYRQLADRNLLCEAWGGQTITVPCSAVTKEGVDTLLEMLALQAEVLELKADPSARARGTVLESQMHKGYGVVTTVLVQNGTLHLGDALVFGHFWGRVKTMRDEHGNMMTEAPPSTPVAITGISGLPEAGEEFIAVENEKQAKDIAEARGFELREKAMQKKALSVENLFQASAVGNKKILNIVLRADVQGSLEALKASLEKLESDKVDLNIIGVGVGEVSESDVQLAAASKAVILGFHTGIESHAEPLIKQYGITVKMYDIIYHAIDEVKALMTGMLDKIAEEQERAKATVQAVFKSSQYGLIAGCIVTDGVLQRNHQVRLMREGQVIWKGSITSLRRVKDDVREVKSGVECGVVLGTNDIKEGDTLEAFEIVYLAQSL